MERRSAIRDLVFTVGGVILWPSCKNTPGSASIRLKNVEINAAQEMLLSEISSTIIPNTDTPGAKEIGVHLFVLKMLDDCYEKEDQQKFIAGLNRLEADTKKRFGYSFHKCSVTQRRELLESIENNNSIPAETSHFYGIMKDRTIQGFLNSKYVMTNLVIYEMIPSIPYNGYAPA